MKKLFAAMAAIAMAVSLTACGGGVTSFDATSYMQGLMDETYLGVFSEDYMKSVDITEEEAQETYETGLETEYYYFSQAFEFDDDYVSDESHQAVIDLLAEIYQHSKYEVKPATKLENGFAVEIIVEPIDIIPLIIEEYMEQFNDDFNDLYSDMTQEKLDAMSDAEYDDFWTEYENNWVMGIVDLFHEHMEELGHLSAESIIVQFKKDSDGYYGISDTDFSNLDALVLAYNYR